MTPQQVALVQASFAKVVPIADQAAALFYGRLFETAPETRALFHGDMGAQGQKLMGAITTVVTNLDNLGAVVPVAQELAQRHVGYGVRTGALRAGRRGAAVDLGAGPRPRLHPRGQRGMGRGVWRAVGGDDRRRLSGELTMDGRAFAKERLVVVGNGMAAMRTVEELLARAPERFAVTVIGAEPQLNHNRIMLVVGRWRAKKTGSTTSSSTGATGTPRTGSRCSPATR